eukprot:scaffold1431_cov167-Ochromonas_danica.AAC.10
MSDESFTRRQLVAEESKGISFLSDIIQHTNNNKNNNNKKKKRKKVMADSHSISFLSPDELHAHRSVEKAVVSQSSSDRSVREKETSHSIAFLSEEEQQKHNNNFPPSSSSSSSASKKKVSSSSSKKDSVVKAKEKEKDSPFGIKWSDHDHHHQVQPAGSGNGNGGIEGGGGGGWTSPSLGSMVTPENMMSLLMCPNQSKCIVPQLQLQKKVKVYYCRHPTRHGVRFYYLVREGLLLHPNVELIAEGDIHQADYVVYLPGSTPWHLTECNKTEYAPKLIVLDEFDGVVPLFLPTKTMNEYILRYGSQHTPWFDVYFKRSFVRRSDGGFVGFPHLSRPHVFPLTYSLAEAYLPHRFNFQREIDILCTLRGHKQMQTRLRVQEWVAAYGQSRNLSNVISGQVTGASRTTVSVKYFQQMYNAKIIVTVNPAQWEGDFRLWESLSSGALVFVDPLFVPHPFPLIHEEHVIFFSNKDKEDLFKKLDYYRNHPEEGRKIAYNGYLHAMKHHRTVNMMDYVLRTAHLKQASAEAMAQPDKADPIPQYSYTGQYLVSETRLQEAMIKRCDQPGIYEAGHEHAEGAHRLTC